MHFQNIFLKIHDKNKLLLGNVIVKDCLYVNISNYLKKKKKEIKKGVILYELKKWVENGQKTE